MRVASVPSDHVYVRHLSPVDGSDGVVRLPVDPPGPWRPSPVLEPSWLREHRAEVDVVHLHFGYEHLTAAQLTEWVEVLGSLGLPLVLTVHDLANPHLADQRPHRQALALLVAAATEVVTLTPGAALDVLRLYGRVASVVPHPHVVPLDRVGARRPTADGFTVDLHTSARANNAGADVRDELAGILDGLPDASLLPPPEGRLDDDALWDRLSAADVLVLPYRFGTHSGFVEACHDLGTTVVASRTGHLAGQQQLLSFDLGVPGSLERALRQAYDARPAWQADRGQRARQREDIARTHGVLYARAVA